MAIRRTRPSTYTHTSTVVVVSPEPGQALPDRREARDPAAANE
jgi:hypothetical protein